MTLREETIGYIREKYGCEAEYLWRSYPNYAVFRHGDNRKWFAVVMDVPGTVFGLPDPGTVDVLNVKSDDPILNDMLVREEGYFRAFHMNKRNWLSILLDGTVPFEAVCGMIDGSYLATAAKEKKQKARPAKAWIVPANPKFYDVEGAFRRSDEIDWKQGSGIKAGDTVYLYVAAPVSAILYQCKVTETDIPYDYADENLTITALMKLRLLRQYPADQFTFERLRTEFGINAVRGPRGVPYGLEEALKEE